MNSQALFAEKAVMEALENNAVTLDKYRGCLVGLAVGDALGVPLEFSGRGILPKVTEMIGQGPFHLRPGEWTDDTSMALCLGQSLLDCNGFDADDQMKKYWRWVEEGYMSSNGQFFDIGNTTSAALEKYRRSKNPFAGSVATSASGNGSLMRIAPIPMFFRDGTHITRAQHSSMTTHGTAECVGACILYSELIIRALEGKSKEEMFEFDDSWREILGDSVFKVAKWGNQVPLVISQDLENSNAWNFGYPTSGYVMHTLATSIFVFSAYDNFEDGLIRAVNLAGDSDTTGAVYGQLAGAYYGYEAIPERWLKPLAKLDMIVEMADKLLEKRHV